MPPTKTPARKPAAKAKAKPKARRTAARPSLPHLEQRHLDLLGLALVALGVFLAFPLYLGFDGGAAGGAVVDGLTWAFGRIAYVVPVLLVAAGALLVLRPVLPAVRPFRSGGACLLLGLLLAFAAGTFGDAGEGGRAGALLHDGVSAVIGDIGAHVLAIFLLLAATLLLTGASVAGVLTTTGRSVADTTQALRARRPQRPPAPPEAEPTVRRRPKAAGEEPTPEPEPEDEPDPEPDDTLPRSTELDGSKRYPDLYGADVAPVLDEPAPEPDPEPEPDPLTTDPEPLPPEPEPRPVGEAPPEPVQPELPERRDDLEIHDDGAVEYLLPDPRTLARSAPEDARPDTTDQERTSGRLVEALSHLGVQAQVIGAIAGPHITRYELQLAPGVKMAKVANLKNDLAYALAATDIRILAPIPGKRAVGVEVPNRRRKMVTLGDVFGVPPKGSSPLTVWLGKDVSGKPVHADLAKMPHLLVAGTTGAGKSGCVNAMLSSILLQATPQEVRLVLVDPKQVELNHYEAIPHLLTPVITSPRMAANALQNLVREMEWRYGVMSVKRTRSLVELNKVRVAEDQEELPYILCVIDELADLMMVAPADVEDSIIRLAQKARAVGIHLVLATQSPRVDVITGMIKANVPSRIAFAVSSQTDSRVILDQNGAESLLGQGDMLFNPVGSSRLTRIQGAYIDEPQIAQLTEFWARQGEPQLREDLLEEVEAETPAGDPGDDGEGFDPDEDPLLGEAIQLVVEMGTASTSMLQRRLRLGYTRAGRLIDMLERRGIISGYEGSKPRQVLVTQMDLPRVLAALGEPDEADGDAPVADPVSDPVPE
jgi:S-DNA-T family DNA segregation ATPase FtsK/SpoIIIE